MVLKGLIPSSFHFGMGMVAQSLWADNFTWNWKMVLKRSCIGDTWKEFVCSLFRFLGRPL